MTSIDDYVRALDLELRDQPRRVRRAEAADLREHLAELPADALDELEAPAVYAHEYRTQRNLRTRTIRRNWRRMPVLLRIAFVLAIVVIAAAVAVPAWTAHYQPLTANYFGGGPDGATSHEEHDATVYAYRDGAILRLNIEFRNSGPFDATITGFDDSPLLGVLKFSAIRVWKQYPQGCCLPDEATLEHFPVRIPSHTTVGAVLELRMTNCQYYGAGAGDSIGYNELRFPMKILGVHHEVVEPLFGTSQIYIDMPATNTRACPHAPAN